MNLRRHHLTHSSPRHLKPLTFSLSLICLRNLFAASDPDASAFPAAINACADASELRAIHSWILKWGSARELYSSTSLVRTYSRIGLPTDAHKMFDEMPDKDLGAWNALVSGFCRNGRESEALRVFRAMLTGGVGADPVTITSVLPACTAIGELVVGRLIHVLVLKLRLDWDVYVCNALINMYAKLGHLADARRMFDGIRERDLVSWNCIIGAYDHIGDTVSALGLYRRMEEDGVVPDKFTMVVLASLVAQVGDSRNGCALHGYVMRRGWDSLCIAVGNAILDMYGKMNMIERARNTFRGLSDRDVISWNTMITAFSRNGLASEAIEAFDVMEKCELLVLNQGSFVGILPALAQLGALHQGMRIHSLTVKTGLDMDMFVGTCLIDMYAKCGRLHNAAVLFEKVPVKSIISWNTVISSHGIHGHGVTALGLFETMLEAGVKPDNITFLSLLSACNHCGLVGHGKRCFLLMRTYGIEPGVEHYACMVDMLGRSGDVDGAYELIRRMPFQPDAGIWGAFLSACRTHGNIELGKVALDHLREIDPENIGYYVLLSNMYAKEGRWGELDAIRSMTRDQGLWKTPGWSSVEVNNRAHVFFTWNPSHPQGTDVSDELIVLLVRMKSLGCVPDTSCVLHDVEDTDQT